jgi:hypothetical protein
MHVSALMKDTLRGNVSDRLWRLFACACCRCEWNNIQDDRCRRAVEIAERYADGMADEIERFEAWKLSNAALGEAVNRDDYEQAGALAHARNCLVSGMEDFIVGDGGVWRWFPLQAVDELFGIVLITLCTVSFPASWRSTEVMGIAEAIYDEREFSRMPILADALEDAGCDDRRILIHCRQDDWHVRGCWVLDLILGKE